MRRFATPKQRARLFEAAGGHCAICGLELGHDFHADHTVPWRDVNETNPHAMRALCPACNLRKATMKLRRHQQEIDRIARLEGLGINVREVFALVTPGGGKSALPVIMAHRLIARGVIDKVLWIVPRDSLREQAERAFDDKGLRKLIGHGNRIRASGNEIDPSRDERGYVTTYQALASDPTLHSSELARHRYLLVLDEVHHLADLGVWRRAAQLVWDAAAVRLLMTGSGSRADGQRIAFLPYLPPDWSGRERVDVQGSSGLPTVYYDRVAALAEKAILPIYFERFDGQTSWIDRDGEVRSLESLRGAGKDTPSALFTALREDYAHDLLKGAVDHWQAHREDINKHAKLLVIAPGIGLARKYLGWLAEMGVARAAIATSDDSDAAKTAIKRFKGVSTPELDVLVTVQMAYEGMDVPAITHIACLTHIRSKEWIEQMLARAVRIDPRAGEWEEQAAHVWAPDDDLFSQCIAEIRAAQAAFVQDREERPSPRPQGPPADVEIVPLRAAATDVRGEDMQTGEVIDAEEFKRAKAALAAAGLSGVTVQRFMAAKRAYDTAPEPEEEVAEETPEPTVSETETRLRKAIDQRIKRACEGDGERIKDFNRRIIVAFGVPRHAMTEAQLRAVWAWLDTELDDAAAC
jgi:superfamily II DNA or RNA helicase